ncbi:hypothetical protein NS331_16580 [Pseudacidovorax intermedius]|uniref:Uncharacterized protein n=1 Tax=Pseudacidovorax intermedius TaxID=433924 RepID=A0A147GQF4_9BURK|nr:hypothetical protein NS331_16580 [Pseudacidovorax intermedius]
MVAVAPTTMASMFSTLPSMSLWACVAVVLTAATLPEICELAVAAAEVREALTAAAVDVTEVLAALAVDAI